MEATGNQLTIKHVQETKHDEYTCVVKSTVGTATASSSVRVIPKSKFSLQNFLPLSMELFKCL